VQDRLDQELALLRKFYNLEYVAAGLWVRILSYMLPAGWNRPVSDVVFQIHPSHPGTPPYGIYTPAGLLYNGARPNSYAEPAGTAPPFLGTWGVFSWQPADGEWRPTANLTNGTNLLTWVRGFADRFREGV
jgi:hypothetical protein